MTPRCLSLYFSKVLFFLFVSQQLAPIHGPDVATPYFRTEFYETIFDDRKMIRKLNNFYFHDIFFKGDNSFWLFHVITCFFLLKGEKFTMIRLTVQIIHPPVGGQFNGPNQMSAIEESADIEFSLLAVC